MPMQGDARPTKGVTEEIHTEGRGPWARIDAARRYFCLPAAIHVNTDDMLI
ncbi:hypothetical protein QBC45DRAFT_396463, partial [Copromyces sp. CBS 386.78]